jgi:hypothetical protein
MTSSPLSPESSNSGHSTEPSLQEVEWETANSRERRAEYGETVKVPGRRFWLLNLLWMPHALFILYLIVVYAVDLPTIDQWDGELPFLQNVADGRVTFGDLIAPQLEHRVATNRAIGYLVAKTSGWNHKIECGFVWLFACGCAFNICILACRQPSRSLASRMLQFTLMAALLFGIGQYASWTNCFAIQWFCVEWYLLTGLVVAGAYWPFVARYSVCMALALISTYSSSNGLLTWFLFLPALLAPPLREAPKGRLKLIGIWAVVAVLAIGGYFVGYQRSDGGGPSVFAGLQDPIRFVTFFLANVGSPFARGTGVDSIAQGAAVGAVVLTLALTVCVYVFFQRKDGRLVTLATPWLALGAYAMTTGLAMTLGRAASGISEAIASRYLNTHVLSVIALVFLIPLVMRDWLIKIRLRSTSEADAVNADGDSRQAWTARFVTESRTVGLMTGLTTGFVILHLCYSVMVFDLYPHYKRMFLGVKAAVLMVKCFADESLLKWAWTKPVATMLPAAEFLDAQGYLRPKLIRSARIQDLLGTNDRGLGRNGQYGAIEQASRPAQNVISLSGWAVFPGREEPADAVLLSWETSPQDATVFAIAQGGPHRDDLAARLGIGSYRWAGWIVAFDTRLLPKGNLTIRAWAFDMKSAKAFELNESFALQTQ